MSKGFNEATRVQMPAMVHLTRLGYKYYGKLSEADANSKYDPDTNILLDVFRRQFAKLNPERTETFEETFKDIKQELDNNDIGKSFYKRLRSASPVRLIDFDNPKNNEFHFTAEFTCKRDGEEFRPDITLFVNGLPLCFIEVKKPNNPGGMIAESNRMTNQRFPNRKFRRFINITQLMIFSNNMEYDTLDGIVPVQGAFYCTGSKSKVYFNCFREENKLNEPIAPYNKNYPYLDVDSQIEKKILSDFNCQVIHTSPEYQSNLDINTPTNRIITSMCSKERLLFLIKYGIAYVKDEREVDGVMQSIDEKQIMRYQQLFAALAIREKIDKGSTGDLTLTAQWEPIEYTIVYELNGGENAESNPQSYTVESFDEQGRLALAEAVKKDVMISHTSLGGGAFKIEYNAYPFLGWYSEPQFVNKVESLDIQSGSVTLYAKWGDEPTAHISETEQIFFFFGTTALTCTLFFSPYGFNK